MPHKHIVIAIDGPAASGKSSVSRLLARKLNLLYINSGAMYRTVTWAALEAGLDPADVPALVNWVRDLKVECGYEHGASVIKINGVDPESFLRDPSVNEAVSQIASVPEIRSLLVEKQRAFALGHSLVMEGRDIGSVVFPDTPYKFYIDASEEVRARRRQAQGEADSIARRDAQDSSRKTSPLTISEDAHVIDSSHLTLEGVVGEIIGRLKIKSLPVEL